MITDFAVTTKGMEEAYCTCEFNHHHYYSYDHVNESIRNANTG